MQLAFPFFEPAADRTARRGTRPKSPVRAQPPSIAPSREQAEANSIPARIIEATQQLSRRAEQLFGIDLRGWSVHCDLRGLNAGQVQIHRRRIRFNPEMAAVQPDSFMKTTIAHEVAHVVCHLLHGRRARPHGHEWRRICLALGGDGLRCHDFAAAPARQLPHFSYSCGCRTWSISSVRVRRMRRGTRYHCRACGQPLRPAD